MQTSKLADAFHYNVAILSHLHLNKVIRASNDYDLLSMETWAAAKKTSVTVAVALGPVRVTSQRPLAPSVASVMSVANSKGDIEMILGAVHRSDICLTAEENLSQQPRPSS